MVDYKRIVENQKAAIEYALQNLDDSEPLDAADEENREGMRAAVDALDATLLAFSEAEEKAIDAMAAQYAGTGRIESIEAECDLGHQILEAQRNRQDVLDAREEEQKARGLEPEDFL